MDGRVALRVQGGPPGTEQLRTTLSFSLFVPERLEEPILPGPRGAQILAHTTAWFDYGTVRRRINRVRLGPARSGVADHASTDGGGG